jgi:Amt family ammonium transporter
VDGLVHGNPHFFVVQCIAVLISSAWAFLFTLGMLWLIDRITPVKVTEVAEEVGLDEELHGEKAYTVEA